MLWQHTRVVHMLHEVVNYKMKGTGPRRRPRTKWLSKRPSSLSCLNEYLVIDSGGNVIE